MHKLHKVWYNDVAEGEELQKVQDFLGSIRWRPGDQMDGGITWLELFILYHIRGEAQEQEVTMGRLKATPKFQSHVNHR